MTKDERSFSIKVSVEPKEVFNRLLKKLDMGWTSYSTFKTVGDFSYGLIVREKSVLRTRTELAIVFLLVGEKETDITTTTAGGAKGFIDRSDYGANKKVLDEMANKLNEIFVKEVINSQKDPENKTS